MRAVWKRVRNVIPGMEGCGLKLRTAFDLIGAGQQQTGRQIRSAVRNGGNHRDDLNGRYRNLLPHRNRAHGSRPPTPQWLQQPSRLGWKFNATAVAKTKRTDVFIEDVRPHTLAHTDSANIARNRKCFPRRNQSKMITGSIMHRMASDIQLAAA